MIRIRGRTGELHETRALLDNGSQVNLISLASAQQLKLKIQPERTTFTGLGGNNLGTSLGEVTIQIRLRDGGDTTERFHVVRSITSYHPMSKTNDWDHIREELADPEYHLPGKINALLGVAIWIRIVEPEILRTRDNLAIAQKTRLGYVIFGNQEDPYQQERPYIGSIQKGASVKRLMEMIQRLWEVEEIPGGKRRTREEELCEQLFQREHQRTKGGRYVVRIPFNDKLKTLGKSRKQALSQFFAMENKMRKTPEFAEKYKLFMSEYEALGHMNQILDSKETGYYTPHHGVLSSNKFRVVFNASAKTTSGLSLNEVQLVGEKLQPDLFLTLMNFRRHRIGITADIEKMYRQVLVHPDDRKYQKILWREHPNEPIKTFELRTVTYGHACAPHCAVRALIQCAEDHKQQFPRGARIIKQCFYVDDLLTGADTSREAEQIQVEITELLKKGKFNIVKWKTNGNTEIMEFKDAQDEEQSSVLGLCWNLKTDKFFYRLREVDTRDESWTKRRILSRIGKLYDPNGYLGPVIMSGKIIIQDLWKDNLGWDEDIRGPARDQWKTFNEDLENIGSISIDRWLGTSGETSAQLHGFCDASEKGYGAVVYIRVQEGKTIITRILASKSRVAPLKVLTIPRLELCAATLLVNLLEVITPIFEKCGDIYCWSDSQIVLQWIRKPSNTLKTYVANRVSDIQTKTEKMGITWRWIKGQQNPADLISRGTTIRELSEASIWWNGPEWLKLDEGYFPNSAFTISEPVRGEMEQEIKGIHTIISQQNEGLIRGKWYKYDATRQRESPLLETYGELRKLGRVLATVQRAIHNFRNPRERKNGPLQTMEFEQALRQLLRWDQEKTFPGEFRLARDKGRTLIKNLVIFWDREDKLLRIDGRVRSDNLTRDEQFPAILHKNGHLAPLLIRYAHLKTNHGGNQLTAQFLRQKFWILGARGMIRQIIRTCPICFKLRMATTEQLMATLPPSRTTPSRAFARVGVDYAGPVTVRSTLGRLPKLTKAWICVFVCLVTRAIHLELVSDLTTQAFIAALKRMISRRGIIREVISDNGTTFVGANNYLRAIVKQLEEGMGEIEDKFDFKWTFTTPKAPHQGGIYEAAVKSAKHHLVRVIGETTLTFEEYSTILYQVEACVNSRPISPLNDDPTSLLALTPGHFLIGEPLVRLPDERDFQNIAANRLNRWEHVQKMTQHFWTRWHEEYLSTLINRPKWLTENRNIQIGDLVVLREDDTPPLKWKLARVQEVIRGTDNLVRSAIIRTSRGVYKRPVAKLGLFLQTAETEPEEKSKKI